MLVPEHMSGYTTDSVRLFVRSTVVLSIEAGCRRKLSEGFARSIPSNSQSSRHYSGVFWSRSLSTVNDARLKFPKASAYSCVLVAKCSGLDVLR